MIAFERGGEEVKGILRSAFGSYSRVVIPASALAQAWRGGPRAASLARLTDAGEVDPLSEERAKEIGVRLGLRDASDIADAHAVCCAAEIAAAVVTSDPDDIRSLAKAGEPLTLIAV